MTNPITFKEYKKHHKNKTIHTIVDKIKKDGVLFYPEDIGYIYDEMREDIKKKVIKFVKEFDDD